VSNADQEQLDPRKVVAEHRTVFIIEGIVLLLLGAAAIAVPPIATLSATIVIGWVLMISGVAGLISTFGAQSAPGFLWSLVSAAIAVVAGGVLIWSPVGGAVSLTLLLIAFFAAEGVATIFYALSHRDSANRWGWLLASGVVDIVLAAIILTGLPGTAAWALGTLVGINLLFGGAAMLSFALGVAGNAPRA
jgi:uncharacterized membrane protein HdeD (DUF308 family)